MIELKRILVGIDFSEYSREAARFALVLAKKFEAEVDFLYVCDLPTYIGSGYGPYQTAQMQSYLIKQREMEAQKREEMERFIKGIPIQDISISYLVTSGNPPIEIIRTASERESNMIVVGTHGRTGISQLLIGSVAEKVVRKSPCPVLTVKLTNQNFVMTS